MQNKTQSSRKNRSLKKIRSTWKKIFIYCRDFRWPLIFSVIFSVGGTGLMLLGPGKLSEITNLIAQGFVTGIDMDKVKHISAVLLAIYILSFAFSALKGWIMSTVTQKISQKMRRDISEKINRLPMAYFGKTTAGDILSRVTNDVDTLAQSLNQSIGNLLSSLTLFFGSFILMLVTDLRMTLYVLLTVFLGFFFMMTIMRKSQKDFVLQQKYLGALNGHIEEIYSGQVVVKAYNAEDKAKAVFDALNGKLLKSAFRANLFSGMMMPVMHFTGNLAYVTVCVTGALQVLEGRSAYGIIVAFMVYVRYFTQPLSQMAQAFQVLQSAAAAGERVFEFLEAEEMPEEEKNFSEKDTEGHVVFEHVCFGYTPEKPVIKDFTLEALPGQKVSLVGPTGSGKTTLISLLMKFYDVTSGDIKVDGRSIKSMPRKAVHDLFGMVLQDTWIFEGTIRENLVYAKKGVSDAEVERATKAVGLHHFIRTLPKGYDTVLDEALNLSEGQKQQLTIARAMIDNKPMLILDEATSSVDTHTEQQIQRALDALMEGRTSFVIAHRLSTIRNSDQIIVLKDGEILETGHHESLMAKNGFYAELYNSQF